MKNNIDIIIKYGDEIDRYLDIIEFLLNNIENRDEILSKIYEKYKTMFYMENDKILFIKDDNK